MCYWPYIHELVDIAGQMYRGTQTCRVIFITERIRGREDMIFEEPLGTTRLMPLGQHPLSVTEESLELPGQPYTASICIDIASLRQQHARSAPYPHVDLTAMHSPFPRLVRLHFLDHTS